MLEVARRTFIYRDNSDLLGTEKAGSPTFAQLIEDIPVLEGAMEVQRKLVEIFPEEAHFWAHLGRFYSVRMRDYERALESINRAISLQDADHVLHHMRGMALRHQIYQILEGGGDLAKAVMLTREACAAFQKARDFKPDNEHGFISEVQLLTRVIDYAGQQNSAGVLGYLSSQNADPYLRDCLEHAEDLLEQVRRNREGEGASTFEQDCRAKVDALYGKHEDALQKWDQLLIRKDVYGPPVRRQIVWTYLARRGRSWDALSSKEVTRIVKLLEENLAQEPNHDRNLRLWVQAIRRSDNPPTIDSVIEKVAYWKNSASDSLDAVYYLYVFHTLRALEGSQINRDTALRFLEECKTIARFRRNRTKSLEWLGPGTGVNRLVHHSRLGEWQKDKEFWENPGLLARIPGRISKISEPQSGQIELQGGMSAFFVPAKGDYFRSHSENKSVSFYLGFSYDGLRAWEVQDLV
jgi:tetratricopeptide (TPR) repeat protein